MRTMLLMTAWMACSACVATGQFPGTESTKGPQPDKEQVQRWEFGIVVTAASGPCRGIVGTTTVPVDWPEQRIRIVEEDFSPFARVSYRTVGGNVKQMVVAIPELPAGEEARAVITVEVSRHSLLPPPAADIFQIPPRAKLPKDVRPYLGSSPYIESQNGKIKSLARQIMKDTEGQPDWNRVEAIYDWVREHVEYKEGPMKGAVAALKDETGDCEELTSLFIALCRASGIPARTVWIPGHCYPEFYLQDADGEGYWFPCQAAGTRAFGGMPEYRPVLQKGDNIRLPEKPREAQRYAIDYLTGAGGKPKVKFIRRAVDAVR